MATLADENGETRLFRVGRRGAFLEARIVPERIEHWNRAGAPSDSPRARGPDELRRYQTGDLNAYDTFYRPVLPEYPNLSTSELCTRFGVIGYAHRDGGCRYIVQV